jgi:TRAP-type mannitol/chloroaromatic compound transport system substrate-binding protein
VKRIVLAAALFAIGADPVSAQTTTWKMQSAFGANTIFHEMSQRLATLVSQKTGGRLRIDALPTSAVVKSLQLHDAVHKGVLDAGFTTPVYLSPRNMAFSLLASPPFGPPPRRMAEWMSSGEGGRLHDDLLRNFGLNMVGFACGSVGAEGEFWSNRQIRSAGDLRGLRVRVIGLQADLYQAVGAISVQLPGSEIIPALERGVIDATNFNTPANDHLLGLHEILSNYYYPSVTVPLQVFTLVVNRRKWTALPRDDRNAVRAACTETLRWSLGESNRRDGVALAAFKRSGISIRPLSPDVVSALRSAWRRLVRERSADNPDFARVHAAMERAKGVPLASTPPSGAPPAPAALPPPAPRPQVASTSPPAAERRFPRTPIPVSFRKGPPRPDDIAVIIGNADYTKLGKDIPDVTPAYADAAGIKRYVTDALGVREGNIIDLRDATLVQLAQVFGTATNYKGQLFNWIKPGRSRVFIFYAGHGAPAGEEGSAFLIPANANGGLIEVTGYSLASLYENLGKLPVKSVTVVLEACFSGASQAGTVISNASPVFLKAKVSTVPSNVTLIAAGNANQMASWEQDKSRSLFTSYFLKGMSGEADAKPYGNGDGNVNLDELDRYLKDTLTYYARRYYGRDQVAQIIVGKER